MTRKASKTTTGWRKRYLVGLPEGTVRLLRGKGRKGEGGRIYYLVHTEGKWRWTDLSDEVIVDNEAELAALRLKGIPVNKEPRWKHYL